MTQVTVTGFTAARSQAIEDEAIIGGSVNSSGHLILEKNNGSTVDAGSVILAANNGIRVCTSSTRPAGVKGLGIFETDTNKFLIYDGIRWSPPWNEPWGAVGSPLLAETGTSNQTIVSPTEASVAGLAIDFNPVANRRYMHTVSLRVQNDTAFTPCTAKICNAANDELRNVSIICPNVNGDMPLEFTWIETGLPTAVGVTRKIRCIPGGSGVTMTILNARMKGQYSIYDMGPDGAPAA